VRVQNSSLTALTLALSRQEREKIWSLPSIEKRYFGQPAIEVKSTPLLILFIYASPYSRAQLSQRIFFRLSLETPSISKNSFTACGKSESPCG
jgi:hypothetical protein